ncbi:MAG TPA: hypothetical protein VIM63_17470 [Rhodoferax sp.]
MPELSLAHFSTLRGEHFAIHLESGEPVIAELVEAQRLSSSPFNGRQPFSLLFKGPASPLLPQQIYQMVHRHDPQPLEIFLVPVSADAAGACYEAVFN